jgi:hypothetical protein
MKGRSCSLKIAHTHDLLFPIDANQLGSHIAKDGQWRHTRANQDLSEHPQLDDAEDRARCADPQRQREDRREREPWTAAQLSRRMAKIGDDRAHMIALDEPSRESVGPTPGKRCLSTRRSREQLERHGTPKGAWH